MQTCNWSSGMWLLPLIVCPSPSWKRLSKVADSMRYEEHERSSSICLQLACLHFSWIMLPLYRPNWPGLELRDLWTIKQIQFRCRFQVANWHWTPVNYYTPGLASWQSSRWRLKHSPYLLDPLYTTEVELFTGLQRSRSLSSILCFSWILLY